jgi:hypothetical protein
MTDFEQSQFAMILTHQKLVHIRPCVLHLLDANP